MGGCVYQIDVRWEFTECEYIDFAEDAVKCTQMYLVEDRTEANERPNEIWNIPWACEGNVWTLYVAKIAHQATSA